MDGFEGIVGISAGGKRTQLSTNPATAMGHNNPSVSQSVNGPITQSQNQKQKQMDGKSAPGEVGSLSIVGNSMNNKDKASKRKWKSKSLWRKLL